MRFEPADFLAIPNAPVTGLTAIGVSQLTSFRCRSELEAEAGGLGEELFDAAGFLGGSQREGFRLVVIMPRGQHREENTRDLVRGGGDFLRFPRGGPSCAGRNLCVGLCCGPREHAGVGSYC